MPEADASAAEQVATPPAKTFIWGLGRRKTAVARVRIRPGSGKFEINKRQVDEYFLRDSDRLAIRAPLEVAKAAGQWDIFVNLHGGGMTGQAGAVSLGLARALVKATPDVEVPFRNNGLLTRDARKVERKKPGRKKARKSFQFSKR
ncbi:MAG: 30S ribosomal protein S9 [Planctomycetes bacterium]|nr:30S ribosomal protein S9 [Planctomycetota bacterium]